MPELTDKIYTCLDAEAAPEATFGYFSNDLAHLKMALEKRRTNGYAYYGRLNKILPENEPRRFEESDSRLVFALFCPLSSMFDDKCY